MSKGSRVSCPHHNLSAIRGYEYRAEHCGDPWPQDSRNEYGVVKTMELLKRSYNGRHYCISLPLPPKNTKTLNSYPQYLRCPSLEIVSLQR